LIMDEQRVEEHHDAAHQAGLGVGGWGKPGNSIGLQFAEGWARGM
jgi:hypothetical protein